MLDASNHDIEQAWEQVRKVFDMNPDPIAVFDNNGLMVIANTVFSGSLNIAQKNVNGLDPSPSTPHI